MKRSAILLTVLLAILSALAGCSDSGDTGQRKIIIDEARILAPNPALMKAYEEYNNQLLKEYRIDLRVITTNSDEDINTFANKAFEVFTKETTTKSGRALLLVINPKHNLVRLEVSMALEPIYTDAFISFIERQHMVRFFRDNRLDEGIFATTEAMYSRAQKAAQGKEFMADMPSKSIGGGAKRSADIGRKNLTLRSKRDVVLPPSASPEDVLHAYMETRRGHNDNPNLSIFTDETKEFFQKWTVTPIQMDNEVQAFEKCSGSETVIAKDRQHAAIIYPIKQRKCCPYLFKKEHGGWKLDFATMSKLIRFNTQEKWHFILNWKKNLGKKRYAWLYQKQYLPKDVQALLSPYLFAFVDTIYDSNGFVYDYWKPSVFKILFREFSHKGKYAGTYIVKMHSRGPGARGGLQLGDRIVSVDGKTIGKGDLDFISKTMLAKKNGGEVHMKIARLENGKMVTRDLTLIAPKPN
jgi:uncharacterized protein